MSDWDVAARDCRPFRQTWTFPWLSFTSLYFEVPIKIDCARWNGIRLADVAYGDNSRHRSTARQMDYTLLSVCVFFSFSLRLISLVANDCSLLQCARHVFFLNAKSARLTSGQCWSMLTMHRARFSVPAARMTRRRRRRRRRQGTKAF